MDIKSANGIVIGRIDVSQGSIIISNNAKPAVIITDSHIIDAIKLNDYSIIDELRRSYELSVGEIASLYNVSYPTMYKRMRELGINTSNKTGRLSSTYGSHMKKERRENISRGNRGKTANHGYERTPAIRAKVSNTLKTKYLSGELSVNGAGISNAWRDGRYDNAPMGRGIQGYFHSNKTSRPEGFIYFRSLLELAFLIRVENDATVISVVNEPVHIKLPSGGIYVPDFLINEKVLIETKPSNHIQWSKDKEGRFDEEVMSAKQYCVERGWDYKIIYDTDIDFETTSFKREIISCDYTSLYKIRFNNPERLLV